jgi:DNA (cytosine-5)-methyltransferase 1
MIQGQMGATSLKSSNAAIASKLRRLRTGAPPRLLDLFSGCGGISLGFHAAGFETIGAVELDALAAKSHAANFFRHQPAAIRAAHANPRDISEIDPGQLTSDLGFSDSPDSLVDVVVGGPPCQAFARVGRAKLREVAEHPEAFKQDPRSNLYLRYLHYVKQLRPLALLMENVPDVLNYGGHNIAEEVSDALAEYGYQTRYTMLNAVYYGVPEMRERMFLIAYRKEIAPTAWFPAPTHWIELPRGYYGSKSVALKNIKQDLFTDQRYYIDPPAAFPGTVLNAVTAREAISDLPKITLHLKGRLKRGARHFTESIPYPKRSTLTAFQQQMRSWPGFEASDGIKDHVIRYLPRDYAIFRRMNPGDQYPEAHQHAIELFEERLRDYKKRHGLAPRKGSNTYQDIWTHTVPPYDPGKFPNKWRKMEADKPARTLMAHLGKDGYSHIHYDSEQSRTISVREAARLQSFPDGFEFIGSMNPAFRQIGNAVPPLLAKAIADTIHKQLRGGATQNEEKTRAKAPVGV